VARKDGENGARAVLQYLDTQPPGENISQVLEEFRSRLSKLAKKVVTKDEWKRLEALEQAEAGKLGLEEFKFASNEEMLEVIERPTPQPAD
jgi:hypothetical protein